MSDNTRSIPLKPHRVVGPDKKVRYAYAATKQGAIKVVRDSLPKASEAWTAEPLTPQEQIQIGRDRVVVLNDPYPITEDVRDDAADAQSQAERA